MQEKLLGLSTWLKMAFDNEDFSPFIEYLLERAKMDENDSAALIDLSTIYYLLGNDALALQIQKQALQVQQVYELSTNSNHPLFTVLVLVTTGDLKANWPIELLLDSSQIGVKIAYIGKDVPWMGELPEHHLVINAIANTENNFEILDAITSLFDDWPRNIVNHPRASLLCNNLDEIINKLPTIKLAKSTSNIDFQKYNENIERYRVFVCNDEIVPYQVVISPDMFVAYQTLDFENDESLRNREELLLQEFNSKIEPLINQKIRDVMNTLGLNIGLIEFTISQNKDFVLFAVEPTPLIHDYENIDKFAYRAQYVYTIQKLLTKQLTELAAK